MPRFPNAPTVPPIDKFSASLREELDYRLDLMAEAAEDEGEPFTRDDAATYQAMCDMEMSDAGLGSWRREVLQWQVSRGVYAPMTDADIANTTVSRGKKWDMVLDGIKYRFVKAL